MSTCKCDIQPHSSVEASTYCRCKCNITAPLDFSQHDLLPPKLTEELHLTSLCMRPHALLLFNALTPLA